MNTTAVVLEEPGRLNLRSVALDAPAATDVVVDVDWSGISTGTERLLYAGRMPAFPGMGYPLVPGYEAVGRVVEIGTAVTEESGLRCKDTVFVPGSRGFADLRALFGGAAARLVVPADKVVAVPSAAASSATLLALAATAWHALCAPAASAPDLIVGHGVLGRLLARLSISRGNPAPVVWERVPERVAGARGYVVMSPDDDDRHDYHCVFDVSGDAGLLDTLIGRLARGGEIVLGGFYPERLSFAFPPAFMSEVTLRVSAQWQPSDLAAVAALLASGGLQLDGLVSDTQCADNAVDAYRTAFEDPSCLKMILDWRNT